MTDTDAIRTAAQSRVPERSRRHSVLGILMFLL